MAIPTRKSLKLLALAGVVFALQGLGYIGGSSMTGTTLWAALGPLIAVLGLSMVAAGLRAQRPGPRHDVRAQVDTAMEERICRREDL
jgi:hypothetical protein